MGHCREPSLSVVCELALKGRLERGNKKTKMRGLHTICSLTHDLLTLALIRQIVAPFSCALCCGSAEQSPLLKTTSLPEGLSPQSRVRSKSRVTPHSQRVH